MQTTIAETIRNSFALIADISDDNVNTCVEAGIARGANRDLHLIARGPRRRPPFMLRAMNSSVMKTTRHNWDWSTGWCVHIDASSSKYDHGRRAVG